MNSNDSGAIHLNSVTCELSWLMSCGLKCDMRHVREWLSKTLRKSNRPTEASASVARLFSSGTRGSLMGESQLPGTKSLLHYHRRYTTRCHEIVDQDRYATVGNLSPKPYLRHSHSWALILWGSSQDQKSLCSTCPPLLTEKQRALRVLVC